LIRTLGLIAFASGAVGGSFDGFEAAETAVELSSGLLALKHSRTHERQADAIAVAKLRAAGRSAAGLADFFAALQGRAGMDMPDGLAWLSTHPLTSERLATLTALAADAPPGEPWIDDADWQALRARLAE
jgi:predicted Zn-dependent protease